MREFDSGATRDSDDDKYDYEGFLDPQVLQEFGAYMHRHRIQADGSMRDSDNWQKGIPLDAYIKSLLRHVFDLWMIHRKKSPIMRPDGEVVTYFDALGAIMFNTQGYWHELLTSYDVEDIPVVFDDSVPKDTAYLIKDYDPAVLVGYKCHYKTYLLAEERPYGFTPCAHCVPIYE